MTHITTSSAAIEELEQRLKKNGRGIRLLAELPLDIHESSLVQACLLWTIRAYGAKDGICAFVTAYPWAFARWLVDRGNEVYESGTLWPHVAAELGADHQLLLGPAFEDALKRLDLRSFPGSRYVAPILGHGMVPRRHLCDLLETTADVLKRIAPGYSLDQLRREIRDHPSMNLRPVIRFLDQQHVDEIVHYYLEQISAVVLHGPSAETPAFLQEAYRRWKLSKRSATAGRHDRASTALELSMVSDGQDYLPVVLRLPERTTPDETWPFRVVVDDMPAEISLRPPQRTVSGWHHEAVRHSFRAPLQRLSVMQRGGTTATFDLALPVWWFGEDGSWWGEGWLERGRMYYLLAAPGAVLNVELEDLGEYNGTWSGYRLASFTATGSSVEVTGLVSAAWPVEAVPARVEPRRGVLIVEDPDPVVLTYGPFSRAPSAEDFLVVLQSKDGPDTRVNLHESDLEWHSATIRVDLSRLLTEWGTYVLRVEGPLHLRDRLQVTRRPRMQVDVSSVLPWPSVNFGAHRRGRVTVSVPPGVGLEVDGRTATPGTEGTSLTLDVGQDQSHVNVTVSPSGGGRAYHESIAFRHVWWEWEDSFGQHILNRPLVARWEDVWTTPPTLRWDATEEYTIRLILADYQGRPIPIADEWARQETRPILGLLDEMRHRSGPAFFLYARICQSGTLKGQYPVARIVRSAERDLRATVRDGHLVLESSDDPTGPVTVTLTGWPEWQHDDPGVLHKRVLRTRLTLQRHFGRGWRAEWHQQLDAVPYELGAVVENPDTGGAAAEPLRQLVLPAVRPGKATRVPFQQSVLHWLRGEPAPLPRSARDHAMWMRAARWLPGDAMGQAYKTVVASDVATNAVGWISGVLKVDGDLDDGWLRVGLAEWPLGAVPRSETSRLMSLVPAMAGQHRVWPWLVVSGLQEWASAVAGQALSQWGRGAADKVRDFLRTDPETGGTIEEALSLLPSALPPVLLDPGFMVGTDGGMDEIAAEWLKVAIAEVRACAPRLDPYAARFIRDEDEDAVDWANVRRLAWLQRLAAWELLPDGHLTSEAPRRIALALSLNAAWRGVYLDALLAADLAAALAYQTTDPLEDWSAEPMIDVK